MSSDFKPVDNFDPAKEKDWAANLGMLDWDETRIVFTKRTLIEFLKYTGTTVDPNFTNISKLPRYAKFGKLTTLSDQQEAAATSDVNASATPAQDEDFKPTRRVRQVPGGPTSDIFGQQDDEDALSSAPPKPGTQAKHSARVQETTKEQTQEAEGGMAWDPSKARQDFVPTRKVRERPGGKDSFWDAPEDEAFKPTRKVRERPGGKDSIGGLFGDE